MSRLAKYEAARAALAEARSIDEVKDIRDKAEAIRAYARMANDIQLEVDAAELRLRAERRLGIMLTEEKKAGGIKVGKPKRNNGLANGADGEPLGRNTLEDFGIDKKLSARSQKVGGIAEQAFEIMVESMRKRIGERAGRVSFDISGMDKKQKRAQRERELGAKQLALPDKQYGVIYADPEWEFEPWSDETGMDRAAENHYATSSTEAIAQRPVEKIAAKDCILFLWATAPMLPDALDVMRAWGFEYKSQCIWRKDRIGTGYWFRNIHEILLLGTRGNIPAPAMGTQWQSVIDWPVREHSRKPDRFYEMIEEYFPTLPKIELNARRARKGWDAWGLEAPESESPAKPKAASKPQDEEFDPETGEVYADTDVPEEEVYAP